MLDVRASRTSSPGHAHGALNVPVRGGSFATRAGFLLDPEDADRRPGAPARRRPAHAIRGLRSVGFLELEGYVLGAGTEQIEPVGLDELDRLLEEGAEVIDVRERDERDSGYIAGSRNIPYRLLSISGADLPTDKPVVTICESGARAGIAASILAAKGVDGPSRARGRRHSLGRSRRPGGRVPPLRRRVTPPYAVLANGASAACM